MRGKQDVVIVMLDDVKENLYELASLVDELGYVARPVVTVGQARKALSRGDVTLLLLDIAMPEMSGFEFFSMMKRTKEWADIPVVFISAYMDQETKREAFAIGAKDYIVRPFDRTECACRIKQAVHQAERIRELQLHQEDMQQMMVFQGEQVEQARRHIVEAVVAMAGGLEPSRGHFIRIQKAAVHFAKGLSVIPEYEEKLTDVFIHALQVAAPLYILGKTPFGLLNLQQLQEKESENPYLALGVELVAGAKGEMEPSLASQIVSLVAGYDKLEGTPENKMEQIERGAVEVQDPLLIHAFRIIQLPYYLDKEGSHRVSYK